MSAKEWIRADELWMAGRGNLEAEDQCFFYYVRDARGWRASHDNDEMWDLKHDPIEHPPGTRPYEHKMRAIDGCGAHLADFLASIYPSFNGVQQVLVPMPTSIPRGEPGYDDRMDRICDIAAGLAPWVSVSRVLDSASTVQKSHMGGTRDVEQIYSNTVCERIPQGPLAKVAILVDDVLTTGAHYAACKRRLLEANPHIGLVIGAFMAIYVRPGDHGYGTSVRDR